MYNHEVHRILDLVKLLSISSVQGVTWGKMRKASNKSI